MKVTTGTYFKAKSSFWIMVILFLGGCYPVGEIYEIEVLYPAEVNIDKDIQRIGILNPYYPEDYQTIAALSRSDSFNSFNGLVSSEAVLGLAESLIDVPRFDSIIVLENKDEVMPPQKHWDALKKLCLLHNVDALVIIDKLDVQINTEKKVISEGFAIKEKAYVNLNSSLSFSIYHPPKKDIIQTENFNTKIRISVISDSIDLSLFEIFELRKTVRSAAYYYGVSYAHRIAPYWQEDSRFLYSYKDEDWLRAKHLADSNYWQEAMDIWINYVDHRNNNVAFAARMNLALGYEMQGIFWKSRLWAMRAYREFEKEEAKDYVNHISRRMQMKEMLDKQMHME